MTLRLYRTLALALGIGVVAWQGVNLGLGRFWHEYIVADLIAAAALITAAVMKGERLAARGMLVGFAMLLGIFLAATTGKLVVGGAHPGTIAAALAIVPCLVGVIGLAIRKETGKTWIGGGPDVQ